MSFADRPTSTITGYVLIAMFKRKQWNENLSSKKGELK